MAWRRISALLVLASVLAVAPTARALADGPAGGARAASHRGRCSHRRHGRRCVKAPSSARRPDRTIDQQGSPDLTPPAVENGGGLGGGPGDHGPEALAWARSQLHSTKWAWRCERFVEEAYGVRFVFDSATQAEHRLPLHHGAVTTAPRGALVYFGPDAYNRGWGHVGLSLGDGRIVSALASVRVTDVSTSRYWSRLYVGWASAPDSWPGLIPPPPAAATAPGSSGVRFTAPAFASTVSGTIRLAASAGDVAGVAFDAYYATNPLDPRTLGWHALGVAQRDADGWSLDWNTTTVPDQGNPPWGTVNVAAIALDRNGARTGTRDYRRIEIDNTTGGGTGIVAPPIVPTPAQTFPEQEGHLGVNTFQDPHLAAGLGPRIDALTTVQVSCRLYDPTIGSVNPDGYWYRIASSPWSNAYYSPANTFFNGDPLNGPYTHNTDFSVPLC